MMFEVQQLALVGQQRRNPIRVALIEFPRQRQELLALFPAADRRYEHTGGPRHACHYCQVAHSKTGPLQKRKELKIYLDCPLESIVRATSRRRTRHFYGLDLIFSGSLISAAR
jgi:hypothetical protein